MSWYGYAMKTIVKTYIDLINEGVTDKVFIGKEIDKAYPFGERAMFPYKAWLKARKEFFSKHGLGKVPEEKPDSLFYVEKFNKKNHFK